MHRFLRKEGNMDKNKAKGTLIPGYMTLKQSPRYFINNSASCRMKSVITFCKTRCNEKQITKYLVDCTLSSKLSVQLFDGLTA